jgi:hypothetical protein
VGKKKRVGRMGSFEGIWPYKTAGKSTGFSQDSGSVEVQKETFSGAQSVEKLKTVWPLGHNFTAPSFQHSSERIKSL